MSESMKKRSEIEACWKWDLTPIFPTDEAMLDAARAMKKDAEDFAARQGHVAEDARGAIRVYFTLMQRMYEIMDYAMLRLDTDNGDAVAQGLRDKAEALGVKVSTAASFFEPELLAMPEEELRAIMTDPDMTDYDEYIRCLLLRKPHTLPAEQERLLAMMGNLAGAPDKIFSMFTEADLRFPDVTLPDGSKTKLSEGNYSLFIHSEERTVRKQAFDSIMNTYGSFGNAVAAMYGASVQKDCFFADAYHYADARHAAMDPLEIPVEVYDNLIAAVHEAIPTLNRYCAVRKRALGVDELHMYDLYAPMVKDFTMSLSYPEAYQLVLDGLAPLGEDYIAKLKEAYTGGWIDVYPSEGKASGAFSAGEVQRVHPYVKLNHVNNLTSASTIAHELGHAMHSFFSNTHQPFPKIDYSLFVAEVASTCNEAIMSQYLLGKLDDPKAQAYVLDELMEKYRTTVYRQTMFAEFECITHDMAAAGEPLTQEAMNKVYYELNRKYYGESCVVDECVAYEWMRIPHFYRAFYVYVYATGFCAAMALSRRILTEGAPAVADYRKFLCAGSSLPPIEALKLAGVDMSRPDAIRSALKQFDETITRFENLTR